MTIPWTAWGDHRPELSRSVRSMLRERLGELTPLPETELRDAVVGDSQLPAAATAALVDVVGASSVHTDDETRARHAGGQSYLDLVRRRRGDTAAAPDAVITPADSDDVAAVLRVCSEHRVAVVPWGGGTSVVGGLESLRGTCAAVIALDLSRLDRMLAIDPVSQLATFQPGIRTPAAEALLNEQGFTLGHFPQSYERASLGGYVVTRSAGQASGGYGRIDDMVAGLRMVTPTGELHLPALPASAAGPDLRRVVLGSEGTLGVVTELTLRVHARPDATRYEGWMLPSWSAGVEALRRLAQARAHPDVTRLSDPTETAISLQLAGSGGMTKRALSAYLRLRKVSAGCLVIVGFEGDAADVASRRRATRRVLKDRGGVALGRKAGQSWVHGRFGGPYLRDSLLDAGVMVETLETAATWSDLPGLYGAVGDALRSSLGRALVGCHVSHLYPTGASLYFTALAAGRAGDEIQQWSAAKAAANDAIVATGGTITHHHAVGTAHRDHVRRDLGAVGIEMLRAVKERLDPNAVMNPGKLLPSA